MLIEKQIDRTLYVYDTKTGALQVVNEQLQPCELPHAVVRDMAWFFKMASVGQHAARIERQRLQDMQE